ncbi:uncharacterized protein MYCFIDRAFT_135445 [Pseudocercospora fijiensis CIRAD86]|uniref:DUF7779 domain-containing protein n=1 Tax=Pseudocercospora fijiensis (strain CIRAD86) TaxID=383855 RepID=M3AKF5_PSEFD|nr:uncharacterized protein MYCFIDRAFT_135445 [Pseudocercospora fijiensis CIRAD86]EME85066.1 hypothetical protein MYCFIDRAFT_135445 [Pseudocercospora fijiensis CIRAD86]
MVLGGLSILTFGADSLNRDTFFTTQWRAMVWSCERSLEPDDLEQTKKRTTWMEVQGHITQMTEQHTTTSEAHEIALVIPTLHHVQMLTVFFESEMGPPLKAELLWGVLGLLLSLTLEDSKALNQIPRMIKSIGYKAEAFHERSNTLQTVPDHMKEACFEMHVQLIKFFTSAVKCIRGEQIGSRYESADPRNEINNDDQWINLDKQYSSLNQELLEILTRVEKVAAIRSSTQAVGRLSLDEDQPAPRRTQYVVLPPSRPRRFFDRVDVFAKMDQVLGDASSSSSSTFQSRIGSKWLIIYDNVESSETLLPFWPETSHGKAVITTRNSSLAYAFVTSGIEVKTWDAQTGSEFLLFLLKRDIGKDLQTEGLSAFELSQKLSGHALGLSQMAGLIHRRSSSISEFLNMYLKNPKRAHTSELQALWDLSFKSLDNDSATLLGTLCFLTPDAIPQSLFELGDGSDLPEELEFITDEFAFIEAVEPLLEIALVARDRDTRTFSIHRLVQRQFRYHLTPEARQKAFQNAVALVYSAFPKEDDKIGQLFAQWPQCNLCLPHIVALSERFQEERRASKNFRADATFCKLLYLCETYDLQLLRSLCKVNELAVESLEASNETSDFRASILSYQANMCENIGDPKQSISLNKQAYEIRLQEVPKREGLISGFENNLGLAYGSANDHVTAKTWFEKSRERDIAFAKERNEPLTWDTNTKVNLSRCLIYLNEPLEAQALLDEAVTALKRTEPREWAVLAYAFFTQGVLHRSQKNFEAAEASSIEAQNTWFEGDETRSHRFNGACIYKIGVVCLDQGKVEAAIKHLRESLDVTKFNKDLMPVEHARSLFKLSEALTQDNHDGGAEAERLRNEAEVFLRKMDPGASAFDTEYAYDRHVPLYWR